MNPGSTPQGWTFYEQVSSIPEQVASCEEGAHQSSYTPHCGESVFFLFFFWIRPASLWIRLAMSNEEAAQIRPKKQDHTLD